jgi:tryptophan-rich sensory protein
LKVLVISLIIVYGVALIGSIFTSGSTDSEWYESIRPSITPPNWVFPVVWNTLFLLIAVALYFSWISSDKKQKKIVVFAYGINFLLNILWSFLYFGLRNPFLAFFEIIILWLSIVSIVYVSYKIDKKAGWLLVPYLLWVSFAVVLNWLSV